MKLGLFSVNMGMSAMPDEVVETVRAAEDAGFESVWAGEHVVLPDPQVPPSPMGPQDPALDPLIALTWAAAHTTRIRLATGIVILPQRNPVVLAKEIASLDVLSRGRFTFGAGVGYLEPEFRAIGADFANRGEITDEYLDAMQHLWYDEHPAFDGRFAGFAGVDAYPRPVQQPIPIVIGGHTPPRVPARGRARPGLVRLRDETRRRRGLSRGTARGRVGDRTSGRTRRPGNHGDAARPADGRDGARVRGSGCRPHRAVPTADADRGRGDDRRAVAAVSGL